jgi:predicted cupin superfamily sugar epimerase
MMSPSVADLIQRYDLQAHPEGGFFRESYRASGLIPHAALPSAFSGDCAYATAIYFLLPQGSKSSWHRIQSDETWHFYLGGSMSILQLSLEGQFTATRLGSNILDGETLQYTVPAGYWFGAIPDPETSYSFVGCTVAPGFDFSEFTLADIDVLIEQFPHARQDILCLSH